MKNSWIYDLLLKYDRSDRFTAEIGFDKNFHNLIETDKNFHTLIVLDSCKISNPYHHCY